MLRYVAVRVAQGAIVVAIAACVAFLLVNAIGNPVNALGAGVELTPQQRAQLVHEYGFDQPLVPHMLSYLGGAVRGDFGTSFRSPETALGIALEALPYTGVLVAGAVLLAWAIAGPLGIYTCLHRRSRLAGFVRSVLVVMQGIPDFLLALLLIIAFAVHLRWLPAVANGTPASYVLPILSLGLPLISIFLRLLVSQLDDVMTDEFSAAMRTRGLSDRQIVLRHALPNSLPPLISYMGLQMGWLLGGTIIIEYVFGWPGIGSLAVVATQQQDLPVVTAVIVVCALAFVTLNLVADLAVAFLDPRIRLASR